jgi:hypothetical protein
MMPLGKSKRVLLTHINETTETHTCKHRRHYCAETTTQTPGMKKTPHKAGWARTAGTQAQKNLSGGVGC